LPMFVMEIQLLSRLVQMMLVIAAQTHTIQLLAPHQEMVR